MPNRLLLNALARSFLAGDATVEQIVARASQTLGRRWRWLRPVAQRYVESFAGQTRPRRADVVGFLQRDRGFKRAWSKRADELRVEEWLNTSPRMRPVEAAAGWKIPQIESVRALADWLRLSESELEWFADLKGLGARSADQRLQHFRYRILQKQSGHLRLIEAPKDYLKHIQQKILGEILDPIPAHGAVHGFVRGRSIKTFAAPHAGRRVVLRIDLKDFFPSFGGRRIQALFRTAGYPEAVAELLGGLCTNAAPRAVWKQTGFVMEPSAWREADQLYGRPHLPQGAPTSPALANLCTYRADCRLSALARASGGVYTRYADDLAFSGEDEFDSCVQRFLTRAGAILLEEGFSVQHRKTRIMRQGVRQHLAGLVANQHVNVARTDFDRLKAILTNCVRHGPVTQNRDGHPSFRRHLEGRVAFVEMINPKKGVRLRTIFDRIQW